MKTLCHTISCLALLTFVGFTPISPAIAQDADSSGQSVPVDAQLASLNDADMDVRIEALREQMTSLDPRLPEALLPLLSDEGNSIRRLAARAVGSRWWQIPEKDIATFIKVLDGNAKSENYDEANMARRATGLLNRDYGGDMFSRSPNKRWVIYERRGLPCLIDTKSSSEELLGWSVDDSAWLSASWSNDTLETSSSWHADKDKEVVALSILLNRKASTVWFWEHRKGLHALNLDDFAKALGVNEDSIFQPGGFFAEAKGWEEDDFLIDLYFNTQAGDDIVEHEALLKWNVEKRNLSVISHKQVE